MDYNGDNFPDEEIIDIEWTPTKIAKAIFKGILYFFVLFIYLFFFFRFYSSCDASLVTKSYLSEEARSIYFADTEDFPIYRIDSTNINDDGTLMLRRIIYADKVDELEIGVRYVINKIDSTKSDVKLEYVLKDSEGNIYRQVNRESTTRYNYGYERVCFGDVDINILENKYFIPKDENGKDVTDNNLAESEAPFAKGTVYTFEIYYNGSLLDSFSFYDNTVVLSKTSYN